MTFRQILCFQIFWYELYRSSFTTVAWPCDCGQAFRVSVAYDPNQD